MKVYDKVNKYAMKLLVVFTILGLILTSFLPVPFEINIGFVLFIIGMVFLGIALGISIIMLILLRIGE